MAKTKQQKKETIDSLAKKIKGAKSVVVFNCDGLKVIDTWALRDKLRDAKVEVVATKKTLLKLILDKENFKDVDVKAMQGSLAIAISAEDEVAPAKIIKDFAKDHEQIKFQGGILEGKIVSLETVNELANLPSKIELLAKVVGSIKAPISGFVNVLRGNLSGLINVLNAIKEIK